MKKINKTRILSGVVGGAIALATLSGAVALNNLFNDTKVDYVVKEEINFNKVDLITTKTDYVSDQDEVFQEVSAFLSASPDNKVYNSYININDDTVAVLVGSQTEFVDELRFDNNTNGTEEWIYIITRDNLVDVSFDTKAYNHTIATNDAVVNYRSVLLDMGNKLSCYMPDECIENLVDLEKYNDFDKDEHEDFLKEFSVYCITLAEFSTELKDGIEDHEDVKDHDLLQTMTLTFLHD